jgi:arylsulfatase A-like enzyme
MQHVDLMPTLLYLAGAKAHGKPLDGLNMWPVLTGEKKTLHDSILINVEPFRGAIRKDNWKLIKIALLPGKTELYDLLKDPGETNNVAGQYPEKVQELEALLNNYAKEQKQSEWVKAQFQFLGAQGKTIFDPDFDIDDAGVPYEKLILPKNKN